MRKFRITTTERAEDTAERATSCAIPGPDPARTLACADSCIVGNCASCAPDTPGYGNDSKEVSPLADAHAQE